MSRKILLTLLLPVSWVFSDVVPLPIGTLVNGSPVPGDVVGAPNTFAWALTINVMPPSQKFFQEADWQMLGYAAFFPVGGDTGQLYVAKKRPSVLGVTRVIPLILPTFLITPQPYIRKGSWL